MDKYAGFIGTRAPGELLRARVALYLDAVRYYVAQGYIIRTGAALGADQVAAETALEAGGRVVLVLPWESYEREWRRRLETRYPGRIQTICYSDWHVSHRVWGESVEQYHPNAARLSRGEFALHARNYGIVRACQVVVALPRPDGGGGTGQGLRICAGLREKGVEVELFNLHLEAHRAKLEGIVKGTMQRELKLWTDAAITKKQGVFGWGIVAQCGDLQKEYRSAQGTEGIAGVCSNYCELYAVLQAVLLIKPELRQTSTLRICLDNEWSIRSILAKAGRPSPYKKVEAYPELFAQLLPLLAEFVSWEIVHIRGHADADKARDFLALPLTEDEQRNVRCDELAQLAIREALTPATV